jgi:hypothetical protein
VKISVRNRLSRPVDDLGRAIRLLAKEELRLYLDRMEALERIRSGGSPDGRRPVWGVLVALLCVLAAVSILGPYYFLTTAALMALVLVGWTAWQIATHAPQESRPEISEWFRANLIPRFRRFRYILLLMAGLLFVIHWVPEMILLRLARDVYASIVFSQAFHYWAAFVAPSLTGLVGGYSARSARLAAGAGMCAYVVVSLGIVQPLYRYGGPWLTAKWESMGPGTIVVSPSLPYAAPVLLLVCCVVGGSIPNLRKRKREVHRRKALAVVIAAAAFLGVLAAYLFSHPAVEWQRKLSQEHPMPVGLVWTGNGSVVALQIYRSLGDIDIGLAKLSRTGGIVWERTYGGEGWDIPESIARAEGGYIVAGVKSSLGGHASDVLVLRVDDEGEVVWNRTYSLGDRDQVGSVIPSEDGGFVVALSSVSGEYWRPHPYLLKIDGKGEVVWNRSYTGVSAEVMSMERSAEGFVVVGHTTGSGTSASEDIYVLMVDREGEVVWEKAYGGDGWDRAYSVTRCTDNGYLIAGGTRSRNSHSGDMYALRLDADGGVLWNRTYGGIFDDYARCVIQGQDGDFVLTGYTYNLLSGGDVPVIKIDADGEIVRKVTYGGLGFQMADGIVECGDGYLITGRAGGATFLLKMTLE